MCKYIMCAISVVSILLFSVQVKSQLTLGKPKSSDIKDYQAPDSRMKDGTNRRGFIWEAEDFYASTLSSMVKLKPVQDNKPIRPFQRSNFGNTLSPNGLLGNTITASNLINKMKESATKRGFIWEAEDSYTSTPSLENQANLPFYHQNSGSVLGQFIQPAKPVVNRPETLPNLADRFNSEAEAASKTTNVITCVIQTQTPISLEYKPSRPFHHPNPWNTVGQIIQPDKPLSNRTENVPNLVDRIKPEAETTTKTVNEATSGVIQTQKPISLEYKPSRPFYHPNPWNTVGQIVPPDKPVTNNTENVPNVVDRIKPEAETTTTTSNTVTSVSSVIQKLTPISLEYKPSRPFYHPNPWNTVGQIIQPDKPIDNKSNVAERVKYEEPSTVESTDEFGSTTESATYQTTLSLGVVHQQQTQPSTSEGSSQTSEIANNLLAVESSTLDIARNSLDGDTLFTSPPLQLTS